MVDFTRYNPPGVYVEDVTAPVVQTTGIAPTVVAIVGPALGYQTYTETKTVPTASPGVYLAQLGIDTSSVVVTKLDGTLLVAGSQTLATPTGVVATASTTGGTLAAATYSYKIVATNTWGQTVASTAATATTSGSTGKVTLTWTAVSGATGYKVYGRTSGSELFIANTTAATYVDTGSVVTPAGALPGSNTTQHGDYSLIADGDQYVLRLVAAGTNVTPATSLVVEVTYNFTDTDYFEVQSFTDYDDVVDVYGPAMVTTAPVSSSSSQVLSPLSLAAKIAFENGANQLLLVALDSSVGSASAQFSDAYSKLDADDRTIIIVPLYLAAAQDTASVTANATALLTHLHGVTEDGNPRIAIMGLTADLADGQATAVAVAQAAGDERLMVAYPNALTLYNGNVNQTTTVDGVYLAAAYAGRLSAIPNQKALTKEQVRSFAGLPVSVSRLMTRTNKNTMSSNGVAVTEVNRLGVMTIRHGVSTDMTNVLTREFSLTRSRDALTRLLQDGLDATGMVGDAITADTGTQVKAAVTGILEQAKLSGLFVDYQDVKVRQQSLAQGGDPTVIEVKFAYKPALPLNYIVVTFALDLSDGTIDLTANVVA